MSDAHRHHRLQPLIERDEALARVGQALTAVADAHGQTVIFTGAPGIGKTRMLHESATLAREAGMRLLPANGSEAERHFPFAGVLQLLETAVREARAPDTIFGGAAALARPVLEGAFLSGAGGALPSAVHGLFWLTVNLAQQQPLALVIDDLHALDDPSLAYLLYLHRRIGDLPVALIAASRPVTTLGPPALSELVFHPEALDLALDPLSQIGVAAFVRSAFDAEAADEFCAECARVSSGNPFYLREVLEEFRLEGAAADRDGARRLASVEPQGVARAVLLRLARLDPGAQRLAQACAILGHDAPVTIAAAVAGLHVPEALRAADTLARSLILEPGQPLRISHPLIASALAADLPAPDRAALHQRAARELLAQHAPDERVAQHLLHAPPAGSEQSVEVLGRCAASALEGGMAESAGAYFARALQEPPATRARRTELLLGLGLAKIGTAPETARTHLEEARRLGADEHGAAGLALALGRALYVAGEHDAAARAFLDAAERLPDGDPLRRELLAWFASASIFVEDLRDRAVSLLETLVDDPPPQPTAAERAVLARAAVERLVVGEALSQVSTLTAAAWGEGALLREETCDGYSWMHITAAYLWGGDYHAAERVADAVIADARARGSVMAFATASYIKASAELFQGRLLESLADSEQTLETHERDGWKMFIGAARYTHAEALLERGLTDEARAVAAALDPDEFAGSGEGAMLRYARGRIALASDRTEEAITELLAARAQAERLHLGPVRLLPVWLPLSEAYGRRGDIELARQEAQAGEAAARRAGLHDVTAEMLVARARWEDDHEALAHLDEAVTLAEQSASRLSLARVNLALGVRRRRAGKRTAAEAPLRTALQLADELGAIPLERIAREELHVLGRRPRRAPASGLQALTASELRVVRLAAEGLTNRAIAEALFVTPKTVEYHLRNAFTKLSVGSRGDLAQVLAPAS